MVESSDRESRELEKLEEAAEGANEPEQIQQRAAEAGTSDQPKSGHLWFIPYLIFAACIGGAILFLDWKESFFRPQLTEKLRRVCLGLLSVTLVIGAARALEVYAIERLRSRVARFNIRRILRLVIGLVVVFIVVSVLFVNWYTAVVSLGLVSLILGFALQTPISSFIGWIYILARAPYRVGDRIQIGESRGDVIDVGYLDTTLWEIGGRHLSTDHPSGRLIKFPNSTVFNTAVFNYSWPLFPYIWNEVKFHIAYESDLEFVGATMQKVAEEELGEQMMDKIKVYRELLSRTPVDHLDVQERPAVLFRVSDNTWLEVIVRYLVHPKESGRVKTRLTRKLLNALNQAPDKVLFPKSNMR